MKTLLNTILFFAFSILTSPVANANSFNLNGKVVGTEIYYHAYLWNSHYKLADSANIIDNSYFFNGEIANDGRFGELPYVVIILSQKPLTEKEINAQRLFSDTKSENCRVFLEESINLVFHSDRKTFSIEGGKLNQVQNLFLKEDESFKHQRDSAHKAIDKLDLSENEKDKNKSLQHHRLLTQKSYKFIEIIKQHPDSEAALNNIWPVVVNQWITAKEVLDTYNLFSEPLKSSKYGLYVYKDVARKIENEAKMAAPKIGVGSNMPGFSLPNETDKMVDSQANFSKYTLIDFWASWCGPCRKETPNIIKAFNEYGSKGFKVITISIDDLNDKQLWIKALKDDRMTSFTNLFNGSDVSGIANTLKIVSIPANYLVDANGLIVATDLRGVALDKKLEELLTK
jgi:thiol-disulfide isomerase/thioredoxin